MPVDFQEEAPPQIDFQEEPQMARPIPPPAEIRPSTLMERYRGGQMRGELGRQYGGGADVSPRDILDTAFKFASVPPPLAKPIERVTDVPLTMLPPVAAGAVQGVRDLALQLPIAAGAVSMGRAGGRALLALFSGEFLAQAPEAYEQYKALRAQGNNQEASRLLVSQLGTALLLGAGAKIDQSIRAGGKVNPARRALANDILELDAAVPGTLDAAKGLIQRPAPETQRQAPPLPAVAAAVPKREEGVPTGLATAPPAELFGAPTAEAAARPAEAGAVPAEARALPAQAAAEASARASEIAKPAWVINLEAVEKAGNLNEAQAERLARWRASQPAAVEAAQPKEGAPSAIQVQSPDEVHVRQAPEDRGAVAEGVPPEGEKPAGKEVEKPVPQAEKAAEVLLKPPAPAAEPAAEPASKISTREVPKPSMWGGKPGEKLYIAVDESGKDIIDGTGRTIIGNTPESAIESAKEWGPRKPKEPPAPKPKEPPVAKSATTAEGVGKGVEIKPVKGLSIKRYNGYGFIDPGQRWQVMRGDKIVAEYETSTQGAAQAAFRSAFGRDPNESELQRSIDAIGAIPSGRGYQKAFETQAKKLILERFKQPTPAAPAEGGIGKGPGAAGAGWVDTAIARLTEGIKALPKSDARQKLSWADRWADMESRGRDLAQRAVLKAAALGQSVRESMRGVRPTTDLGNRVGQLDYLLQRSSALTHQNAEAMRKSMPSEDVRGGLWLFADAHGDLNAIRDTIARMPADTPAKVRRALNAALNLTAKEKAWLPYIRDFYDRRAVEAKDAGVLNSVLEDYFTHIWRVKDNMPPNLQAAFNRGAISEYFQFARERKLPIMLEGIKNPGMIPGKRLEPIMDASKVIPYYNYALDRAMASRAFISSLKDMTASDGRPLVAPSGVGIPVTKHQWAVVNDATGRADPFVKGVFETEAEANAALAGRTGYHVEPRENEMLFIKSKVRPEEISDYHPIDHPSMKKWQWATTDAGGKTVLYEGELLAHPEAFPRLARMLDRSRLTPSAVTKAALRYSGELKAAKLGMLSTFHLMHVGKHALFHWTNPFAEAVRKPIEWESPQVKFAIEQGHLNLAPEPGEINNLSEGLAAAGDMLIHKVPVLGPISRTFSEWMFREYIPRLKLHTFENALARNRAMYAAGRTTLGAIKAFGAKPLTDTEIAARVGDSVNAAYGELNKYWLGKFGRDPRMQRALRLGFLAPDFGEARLRFVGKAFTKYGNEERMALFLNAALVYTAARIGNYLSTGDPQMDDPRHAFEVKVGDHWASMRSVIADLSHAMSDFSQFLRVRLNPGIAEPLVEMLSHTNMRGQPVDAMGQVKDMLRRAVPIPLQGMTESDRHIWESIGSSLGFSARRGDAVSTVHELARKWKKDRGIESPVIIHESPVGNPYREARIGLEQDDENKFWRAVDEQYQRLKLKGNKTPAKTIENAFLRYYKLPFTGNQALEKSFQAEMPERDRIVYQDALKQRKDLAKKFSLWWKEHTKEFAGQ